MGVGRQTGRLSGTGCVSQCCHSPIKNPQIYPQTVSGHSWKTCLLTLIFTLCVLLFTLHFFEKGLLSRPIVLVKIILLLTPISWQGMVCSRHILRSPTFSNLVTGIDMKIKTSPIRKEAWLCIGWQTHWPLFWFFLPHGYESIDRKRGVPTKGEWNWGVIKVKVSSANLVIFIVSLTLTLATYREEE